MVEEVGVVVGEEVGVVVGMLSWLDGHFLSCHWRPFFPFLVLDMAQEDVHWSYMGYSWVCLEPFLVPAFHLLNILTK